MSFVETLVRIREINQLLVPAQEPSATRTSTPGQSFSQLLASLPAADRQRDLAETTSSNLISSPLAPLPVTASIGALHEANMAGSPGLRALLIAQTQVGQSETPPGSNDGPAIATYRAATAGAYAGAPWCAYFLSWAFAQAGMPLGEQGQGYGAVEQIHDWATRTGRLVPAGTQPQPGDIILYGGRHIGIVESVNADGSLTTVEGNHQDKVSRVHRSPSEATEFVRV